MNYARCKEMAETRKRKIDNNTYLLVHDDGSYGIKLHATEIITFYPNGDVKLNSGGWRTPTTKARMNDLSGACIFQHKGLWTVHWGGNAFPYADGMVLHADNTASNVGEDPQAEAKLRKSVNVYVRSYMDAFAKGKVPPPSAGDCWFCCMKDKDDHDHLRSHIEEKYYVPSLLRNAIDGPCYPSIAAKDYVYATWSGQGEKVKWVAHVAIPQLRKALFDYIAHRLGLTPGRTAYSR